MEELETYYLHILEHGVAVVRENDSVYSDTFFKIRFIGKQTISELKIKDDYSIHIGDVLCKETGGGYVEVCYIG